VWSPGDRGLYELAVDAFLAGEIVDTVRAPLVCARVERVGEALVDRRTSRSLRTARYDGRAAGLGFALSGEALARDLSSLAEVGFEAVQFVGPASGRDFERTALELGLWPVSGDAWPLADGVPAVARGDGEALLAAHARAVARAIAAGQTLLLAVDGERGGPGVFDEHRRPKFAYHALRAASGLPTVYPATFWNGEPLRGPLDVYASGDSVELFVGGVSLGRRVVGADPRAPFAAVFEDVQRGQGDLRAVAYDGERVVAERTLAAPAPVERLLLTVEASGVPPGLPDHLWAHAIAVDADGRVQTDFAREVRFTFFGDLEPVGEARVRPEAGVASLLVRSLAAGNSTLSAAAGSVRADPIVIGVSSSD
ncbi:MAG: DUF4982 domain-containing protein, partial [Planctomycetota bacterium]